ncbi:hypothetical protein CGC48_01810 [Capnocytophaga cynodegmi]|uniref:DUF937 domain-containing protein n=1 Tax=Capnocytophaga cynodegmi TaxID=28189 RepID=A0A250E6W2_9FLAO|nr:DUF937 domain-containing protein [Capnocytophaga cynodegmi]ATA67467.1 hypothetical protein CGC48_01810 [Capnocytophaga cynodegmi]
MAGILDFLGGDNLQKIVDGVSKQTGVSTSQVSSVIEMAGTLLMGAMQNNTSGEGATGLLSALQSNKHDGSLLDNLGSFFNDGVNSDVTKDGAGILGHLLGGKESTMANAISAKTGVSSSNVVQILQSLAPVLMSFLGKKVSDNNVSSASGLGDLLSGFLGNNNNLGGMLKSLLDSNGDGNVMDDLAGMLGGKSDNKGGIGDLLGGFLGGK